MSNFSSMIDALAQVGWTVCRDFLPGDQVRGLREECLGLWEAARFHRAGVGHAGALQVRAEIRRDLVLWLDPDALSPLQMHYWNRVHQLREELNREFFLSLREFEAHFAVYPLGAFYKRHLDQFRDAQNRLITCILYLNPGWQVEDGGQLRIYHPGKTEEDKFTDVIPEAGTFVCFRSDLIYHEVLPARRERLSITGWLRRRGAGLPL